MSDIQQFKMEDVQKRVAETIKAQFAMLIPEEAFNEMAKTAINDFFNTEQSYKVTRNERRIPNPSGYGDRTETWYQLATPLTPFKVMLWEAIREEVEQRVKRWSGEQQAALKAEIDQFFAVGTEFHGEFSGQIEVLAKKMAAAMQMSIINQATGIAHSNLQSFASANNLRVPGY
jgi:hypothetical protein